MLFFDLVCLVLLICVCHRSPRFSGGHQQDSHELLRHLMDGLRNEEKEVSYTPITIKFSNDDHDNISLILIIIRLALRIIVKN